MRSTNPWIDYFKAQLAKADLFTTPWQYFQIEDKPFSSPYWWDENSSEYDSLPDRSTILNSLIAEFPTRIKVHYAAPTTAPFPETATRMEFATFFGRSNPEFDGFDLAGGLWVKLYNPGTYYSESGDFLYDFKRYIEPNFVSQFFTTPGEVPLGCVGFAIGQVQWEFGDSQFAVRPDYYIAYVLPEGSCDCCCCLGDGSI